MCSEIWLKNTFRTCFIRVLTISVVIFFMYINSIVLGEKKIYLGTYRSWKKLNNSWQQTQLATLVQRFSEFYLLRGNQNRHMFKHIRYTRTNALSNRPKQKHPCYDQRLSPECIHLMFVFFYFPGLGEAYPNYFGPCGYRRKHPTMDLLCLSERHLQQICFGSV